jgi:hypothetical protein
VISPIAVPLIYYVVHSGSQSAIQARTKVAEKCQEET